MPEVIRIRCPVCGSLPELDRVEELGDVQVEVFLQKFGGKRPLGPGAIKGKGKGSNPGYMEYINITGDSPELVKQVTKLFKKRIKQSGLVKEVKPTK